MTPFEIGGQLDAVLSRVISLDRGMPLMLRHRLQVLRCARFALRAGQPASGLRRGALSSPLWPL